MSWSKIASGLFASKPGNVDGIARVVVGLQAIVDLMRDDDPTPKIIVTNVAGGSAISTIIHRAQAIVSTIGGPNSHVVVVARDYQKPCIVGASQLDLSVLTTGVRMRLRSNGDIEIRKDDLAHATDRQLSLLRKIAFAGAVRSPEDVLGYESSDLKADIAELAEAGLVSNDGLIVLTSKGTSVFESAYVKDRKGLRDQDHAGIHTDFRPLDRELKRIARQWQDAERHDDWDDKLSTIQALTELHTRTRAFFDKYQKALPRLEEYALRLARAYQLITQGSTEYLVSPRVDSCHTIWFQLHEDLLRILQRERDPE